MVRDIHKDKEWFDECIKIDEKLLKKYIDKSMLGDSAASKSVYKYAYTMARAMYSRGDDIALVKEKFIMALNELKNNFRITRYWDNIEDIAVMILCDMDTSWVLDKLNENNRTAEDIFYDDFLIRFLASKGKDDCSTRKIMYEKKYESLRAFIESGDINHFKTFLKNWYNKSGAREYSWKNLHKNPHYLYNGYWNFEGAAVVKLLGLNKDEFKDYKYFPYDLV